MNDEQAIIAKHTELQNTRNAYAAKLAAALTAAGFTVKSTMPTDQWATGVLEIKNAKAPELEHYARFEILSSSRWSRSTPDKLRLTYASDGRFYRGSRTRYTKLTDELITKLVEVANEGVESAISIAAQRNTQANLDAHYAAVKKEQLAGVVVPPGTEVKIVASENDTYAGKYYVSFERHHSSITGIPLTAEQVKKLLAVLNEIQQTATGYIIVGKHGTTGEDIAYGLYGFHTNSDPKMFPSKEAAEAEIERANHEFVGRSKNDLRVMPYADWMRI